MHHGGLRVKQHFGTLYTVYTTVLTIKLLNLESEVSLQSESEVL